MDSKKFLILFLVALLFCIIVELLLRSNTFNRVSVVSDDELRVSEFIQNNTFVLFGSAIDINSFGLRDYEYSFEKPNGAFRIVVIGDSFTFGQGILLNDTYVKQLESRLNQNSSRKYEVINFGFPGYNVLQEYELLKTRVFDFDPDMIILGYFPNDPEFIPGINPAIGYCGINAPFFETAESWLSEKSRLVSLFVRYYNNWRYLRLMDQVWARLL